MSPLKISFLINNFQNVFDCLFYFTEIIRNVLFNMAKNIIIEKFEAK